MARSKKKAAKKRPVAAKRPPSKKAGARAPARARTPGSAPGPGSDVEQRWQEYWQCRQELEAAVEAVREADARLAEAREQERERRSVFNRTKDALRDLLEVEPASSGKSRPPPAPSLFDTGARLGVVEEDDADADADDDSEAEG